VLIIPSSWGSQLDGEKSSTPRRIANLLTRCHNANFLFSVIFLFQKSYTRNILRIGRNKIWSFYFSWHETESKAETEGDQGPGAP
jgi:hypothetical protein